MMKNIDFGYGSFCGAPSTVATLFSWPVQVDQSINGMFQFFSQKNLCFPRCAAFVPFLNFYLFFRVLSVIESPALFFENRRLLSAIELSVFIFENHSAFLCIYCVVIAYCTSSHASPNRLKQTIWSGVFWIDEMVARIDNGNAHFRTINWALATKILIEIFEF